MKQLVEEDSHFTIGHFHLKMHETGHAFGHRPDVTSWQLAFTHATNDALAVMTVVEVFTKAGYLDRRQDDVLLIVIFVTLTTLEMPAAAFGTLIQGDIDMLVGVPRYWP